MSNIRTEKINLMSNFPLPKEYTCECNYCREYKGMIIRPNGTMYNKNDRRKYYHYKQGAGGAGHINPTPLHTARWAIQNLTKEGDTVCDCFMGTGTTAVEAINHGRLAIGTELETSDLANANCEMQGHLKAKWAIVQDDARNIGQHLNRLKEEDKVQLSIWQIPYSGDEQSNAKYNRDYDRNLAFLKENQHYWDTIELIVKQVYDHTKSGGYFVTGIKEMIRNKKWFNIHIRLSDIIDSMPDTEFKGTVLLPHYPRTLHLNTYFKRYGVHPSYYQTMGIWRKK